MQGSSREALAQAWRSVERRLTGDTDAARVGDELFAVVTLLDSQVALRRALSDPSLDARRKTGLVGSILESRISPVALEVVDEVVRARWSRMRDLGDALETLAVLSMLIAAERAHQVDDVEDELFRFSRIAASRPALRDALANRALPVENKVGLVTALLESRTTPITLALALQLVRHPRGRTPEEGLAEFGAVAARFRQRLVARVTSAVVMSDAERDRLRAALAGMYGRDIHLQVEVDPALVGGVVVQLGDEIIDGSIASRVEEARQHLR